MTERPADVMNAALLTMRSRRAPGITVVPPPGGDAELRMKCLELAARVAKSHDKVLEIAGKYLRFVVGVDTTEERAP